RTGVRLVLVAPFRKRSLSALGRLEHSQNLRGRVVPDHRSLHHPAATSSWWSKRGDQSREMKLTDDFCRPRLTAKWGACGFLRSTLTTADPTGTFFWVGASEVSTSSLWRLC